MFWDTVRLKVCTGETLEGLRGMVLFLARFIFRVLRVGKRTDTGDELPF